MISIGKAAHAMVNSLEMQAGNRFEGIVASSFDPPSQVRGFRYFRGGHPTAQPGIDPCRGGHTEVAERSECVVAGDFHAQRRRVVDRREADRRRNFAGRSDRHVPGAGALRRSHRGDQYDPQTSLRHQGWKDGASAAPAAQQVSLLVSDVPDNTPDALASGPTMPDSTTRGRLLHHRREIRAAGAISRFGARVVSAPCARRNSQVRRSGISSLRAGGPLLSNASLLDAAEAEAQRHGFSVEMDNSCDDWDYARAADYLLERLRRVASEVGTRLPAFRRRSHGEGGQWRCRRPQPAVCPGLCDEDFRRSITVLSAGTDGIDGNSPAAGAIVDGSTLERAKARGLDAAAHLAGFNAYPFFESLGDAIMTGPTGNNLRDLRILLAY